MSIKQQGGVFGRNPTFNDVTIEGTLTFDGDIDVNSDLKVDGDLDVTGSALIGTTTANTTYAPRLYTESALGDGNGGILIGSYKPSATFLDFSGGTPAVHRIANDGGNLYFETDTNQDGTFDTVGAHFTSVGNLAFESGKGIDFSATAGTGSTSELLDDYEEGTWTPAFSGGDYTFTYNRQKGSYTKIGNRVFIDCVLYVHPTTAPSGTVDGNLAVIGLPYAHDIQNDVDVVGGVAHFKQLFMSGIETLAARLATGNAFVFYDTLATNYPELAYVQASDVAANTRIRIQFSYPTNG